MENDYKVADIVLQILEEEKYLLAENEMPALMALRTRYKDAQPLKVQKLWVAYT